MQQSIFWSELILVGIIAFARITHASVTSTDSDHNGTVFQPKLIGGYPICLEDHKGEYCNLDRSYPGVAIEQLLVNSTYFQDISSLEKRFQIPNSDLDFDVDDEGAFNFSTTIDNAIPGEEESTCAFRVTTYYPPVAMSEETSKWVYVVNVDKYKQIIKGQVCERSAGCSSDNLPTTYESICHQRFKTVTLLAIDPTTKVPYKDKFKFPSYCECKTESNVFVKAKTAKPNVTNVDDMTFVYG